MVRPTVFVCRGSSCRDRKEWKALRAQLDEVADISEVRCQSICDGPVVGVPIAGTLEWFERVRSEKAQRQLVELVTGDGKVRGKLKKRRVSKREGRLK